MQANRNGFFYVLDRTNGKFLFAKQYARQTWAKGIDSSGRPVLLPGATPTPEGTYVCPGGEGGANWMSPSYSPDANLFYVPVREHCDNFRSVQMKHEAGRWYTGGEFSLPPGEKDWGALRAIDPLTGEIKWEYKYNTAPFGDALSTAGGVVFAGDSDSYFRAFATRTGKVLWTSSKGGEVRSSPMTYAIEGKQYVAVASGNLLNVFALSESAGVTK